MKKMKYLLLACLILSTVCAFTACGNEKKDVTDTSMVENNSQNKKNDSVVEDVKDMGNDVIDGAADAVDGAVNGATDAVKDAGDAVQNGVDDITNTDNASDNGSTAENHDVQNSGNAR